MRGKKAKALRKLIYGEKTFRSRKYSADKNGCIISDNLRRIYQNLKRTI